MEPSLVRQGCLADGRGLSLEEMEPGFFELGWREFAAIMIAVVIVLDWAAHRYGWPR